MDGEVILVVDDNLPNLRLVQFLLSRHGYQIHTATNGAGARRAIAEFRPRLILMDIQLPGQDGLDLTRELKANPATRDILVVALTAYAMRADEERAFSAGCDGYVSKPVDTRALPGLIAGYLGAAHPRPENKP